MEQKRSGGSRPLVADLIAVGSVTPVVSLREVNDLRAETRADGTLPALLRDLLAHYCLGDREARAGFEVILSGLGRSERAGDAFHVQGVPGAGKSHLLAVLALLAGDPGRAWSVFSEAHPDLAQWVASFERPRLVAAVALDEYPTPSHPLEYVVFRRLEEELERSSGTRVALSEESHILHLVERYVRPQARGRLEEYVQQVTGSAWESLKQIDDRKAAATAVEFVESEAFPLDWRRSRAEAWSKMEEALARAAVDGVVVILDELGTFLSSKDRSGLNADASFLQWLAQRTVTSRAWLICATQRGMEEVGDIDRRTLRQIRDRFRAGITLDLSELEWVVRHKIAPRRDKPSFRSTVQALADGYLETVGEELVSAEELGATYPVNPLCLKALRRAAESHLSRTRSAAKLLRETLQEGGWLGLPADRLITLDVVFDVFRDEMGMSAAGRKQLHALEVVMANGARIARGEEARVVRVMKALCVLGLGEVRWSERELRASFLGCEDEALWQDPGTLRSTLTAIYQRGAYVERLRGDPTDGDTFFVDVSSDASAQVRERLNELVSELSCEDSRVLRPALEGCRDPSFLLAALAEPRRLEVMWLKARRYVEAMCCDLRKLDATDLCNRIRALAGSAAREDGLLFVASPLANADAQLAAWREATSKCEERFSSSTIVWLPQALSAVAVDHLTEHAALTLMLTDKTLFGQRGGDFRERVRERWSASEEEVRRLLHRAYYDGYLLAADGREPLPTEQVAGLFGDWEGTLSAMFSEPFRRLFPQFAEIAPARSLTSRAQTNQIVEQFLLPGQVTLTATTSLEAHLEAYAGPLGLVDGAGAERRVALRKNELVEAALAATPARSAAEEIDPAEAIPFGELAGRLCKSEWGLTREQAELVLAALIRTGHLVALDAFVQPLLLDHVRTPLEETIQYVMRGRPLVDEAAERVKVLWEAASGLAVDTWDLPTQERAWGFFLRWAREGSAQGPARAEAITRAAVALEHDPVSWDWAREALNTVEAVARAIDPTLTSREGLSALVSTVDRLPGGHQQTRERLVDWQTCERFLCHEMESFSATRTSIARAPVPHEGSLARERESVLARFDDSRDVVRATGEVKVAATSWLEKYRRHYLAWHVRVHAGARFEKLIQLRQSAAMEAMRRLARTGLCAEESAKIEAELGTALGRRCLAGDPLPAGHAVCPICEVGFKEEVALPEAEEVGQQIADVVAGQLEALRRQAEMLHRRLGTCETERVRNEVEALLSAREAAPGISLTDEVVVWLREQLGQPKARRREVADLVARLQGKELTKQDVLRIVSEWLGDEEGFVEVV